MIKTPVYTSIDDDDFLTGDVYDANDDYIFSCENVTTVRELVKRINMHDELVDALKHVKRVMALPENIEIEIDNTLERCK